ncbi:glycine zipper 2TM domain-containing protein [Roseateles sp. PN1]|uniref:glycine zipper 2TM domain-containing protein n=1 Tax=Roseateles sp. PN1 TaxID=3137372 RepID=UPI00313A1604
MSESPAFQPRKVLSRGLRLLVVLCAASSLSACVWVAPRGGHHHHYDERRGYGHGDDQGRRGYGPSRYGAAPSSGGGALVGGVVGGVLGHAVEPGVGTAIGVIGGAVIGNEIERGQRR